MARVNMRREEVNSIKRAMKYGTSFEEAWQKCRQNSLSTNLWGIVSSEVVKVSLVTAAVLLALRWAYMHWFYEINWVVIDSENQSSIFRFQKGSILWKVATSLAFGLGVSLFTYVIIYMDSDEPGISPPSPLSPRSLRERSGHMLHMCYALVLINGFFVFVYTLWVLW